MSQTVDTNILIYATHTASPFHQRARALVEHLVAGPALTYILWPAVLGYLRIVTNPAILQAPMSTANAISNIESMIAPPHIRAAGEGNEFWASFQRVSADANPRGNLVPDAHLVALMHEHGVTTIWSHDRDFRKFSGIRMKDPFSKRYAAGFAGR
ncbi:MAG TPA: TA system VapC family ribonuclease toxin [Acidimicrobiales bacterium]|nr:TA system VapC family ribonuclease toxin [Acidimicrobiales bacterium]